MNFLKSFFARYDLTFFIVLGGVALSAFFACRPFPVSSVDPAPVVMATPAPPAPLVDLAPLVEYLERQQNAPPVDWEPIPRKGATPPPPPVLEPIPEPLALAIHKQNQAMSAMMARFLELEKLVNSNLKESAGPAVDLGENSRAALDDIFTYVEPPEVPDPLVKAMAKYPGARILADPDTGIIVPAVVEIRETNWGGGKQYHLSRSRGKVYGQTVIHRAKGEKQEPAPPQPPPFRISN